MYSDRTTSPQLVPRLDLGSVSREEGVAFPYQDSWIEGELEEVVSANTVVVKVDFGTGVSIRLKIRGIETPKSSPDRARRELEAKLPVKVKVKPISWEKEGVELLVDVRKFSSDGALPTSPPDKLFG